MDEVFISDLDPRKVYEKSGLNCFSWSVEKFGLIHYPLGIQKGKREVHIFIGKSRVLACKQLSCDKILTININDIDNIRYLVILFHQNLV